MGHHNHLPGPPPGLTLAQKMQSLIPALRGERGRVCVDSGTHGKTRTVMGLRGGHTGALGPDPALEKGRSREASRKRSLCWTLKGEEKNLLWSRNSKSEGGGSGELGMHVAACRSEPQKPGSLGGGDGQLSHPPSPGMQS